MLYFRLEQERLGDKLRRAMSPTQEPIDMQELDAEFSDAEDEALAGAQSLPQEVSMVEDTKGHLTPTQMDKAVI